MTPSSRIITLRSRLLGWFGLALLAGLIALHMVSCLPGAHILATGTGGGQHLSVPMHLEHTGPVSAHGFAQAESRGLPVMHEGPGHEDHRHHPSCADISVPGWPDGVARSMLGMMLAVAAAAVLLPWPWTRPGTAGVRGAPPPDELPLGYWIRHSLRGAMLPAALGVSRT